MAEYEVEGGGRENLPPPPFTGNYKGGRLGLPETGPGSLATFWPRWWGLVIDELLLAPVFVASTIVRSANQHWVTGSDGIRHLVDDNAIPSMVSLAVAVIVGTYAVVLIGRWGKTVGQAAIGLLTIRMRDRAVPGYTVAAKRWAIFGVISVVGAFVDATSGPESAVPVLVLPWIQLLVYAWMLWDGNRQCLHDKFAGTIVVRTR
jgi:hypothetical protein